MKRQPTFATRMAGYLGKPFREGAFGPDAYDCAGLIYRYLLDAGKEIPDFYQQWNTENYFTLACGDKKRENAVVREWLLSMGREVGVGEMIAGDILIVQVFDAGTTPAIYCGNNNILLVTRMRGVIIARLVKMIKIFMVVRI